MRDKAKTAKQVRQLQDRTRSRQEELSAENISGEAPALDSGEIQRQLDQVEMAGKPAVVQKQASLGGLDVDRAGDDSRNRHLQRHSCRGRRRADSRAVRRTAAQQQGD